MNTRRPSHAAGQSWRKWEDPIMAEDFGDSTPTRHRSDTNGPCLACRARADARKAERWKATAQSIPGLFFIEFLVALNVLIWFMVIVQHLT